jgi:tetratricopeptide (TPR) repeat protein
MSDRPMHTIPGAFQKLTALYAEGERALEENRFADAEAVFTQGLAIDDHFRQRYVTMYAQRGFARQRLGNHQGAIEDYGHAIDLGEPETNQAQYHFYRGLCFAALGQVEEAVSEYTRSIELYPDHPGPYHMRGKLYAGDELERFEDAIQDFDKLMELGPHPEGLQLRGYCNLMLDRAEEAVPDLIESNAQAPEPYTSYLLAWAAAETEDADLFFPSMQEALRGEPSYREYFEENEDFARFRADPRFRRILDEV